MAEGIMPRSDVPVEGNNAEALTGGDDPVDAAMDEPERPNKRLLGGDDDAGVS